jgi:hypothetical protein
MEVSVRRLALFVVVLVLLLAGGGLTANLANNQQGISFLLPILPQTDHPDASVFVSTPWKSELLFLLVGAIVSSLIGGGLVLALVMWVLHRQVREARALEDSDKAIQPRSAADTAVGES